MSNMCYIEGTTLLKIAGAIRLANNTTTQKIAPKEMPNKIKNIVGRGWNFETVDVTFECQFENLKNKFQIEFIDEDYNFNSFVLNEPITLKIPKSTVIIVKCLDKQFYWHYFIDYSYNMVKSLGASKDHENTDIYQILGSGNIVFSHD